VNDRFLEVTGMKTEADAMREARNSALQQRQNKVYARDEMGSERTEFRFELARLIREESKVYAQPDQLISDVQHCEAIRTISDTLSRTFGDILMGGRMRYGTSQKALNLYLKFLWRLGKSGVPPHCPVDGNVLEAAGIIGSWTKSDSEKEYFGWINDIRKKTARLSLAEWEYKVWLASAQRTSG